MTEQPGPRLVHGGELHGEAYDIAEDFKTRQRIYVKYATDKTDIQKQALNLVKLRGDETALDVGCGNGDDLFNLQLNYGHYGTEIGVDTHRDLFISGRKRVAQSEGRLRPVDFMVGRAEQIPVDDSSVDFLMGFNMLYHTDVDQALNEFKRVLKLGAKVVVSTWGEHNIFMHRGIERYIGRILDIQPPVPSTTNFNIKEANLILPKWFRVVETFHKACPLLIPPEGLEDYLGSLFTRKNSFYPVPTAAGWEIAEAKVVKLMQHFFDTLGYFPDYMDSKIYVCENSLELAT